SQLEWAHPKGEAITHDGVDLCGSGDPFVHNSHAFRGVSAAAVVDQKPWHVADDNRCSPHDFAGVDKRINDCLCSVRARDDFHVAHQWYGIEEIHARKALGMLAAGCNGSNGNGGGVGCKNGFFIDQSLKLM